MSMLHSAPHLASSRAQARPRPFWRRRLPALLFTALVLTCGCGGGVDTGGTGMPVTGSSSASGPITGFGSVIVSNVRYDDQSAEVRDADGQPRERSVLKLGMVVDVQGGGLVPDADERSSGVAHRIVYRSALAGQVSGVDPVNRTLTLLGQTVQVGPSTVFDTPTNGGLSKVAVGDWLEVYGLPGPRAGLWVATRVEQPSVLPSTVLLRGRVDRLDVAAKRFELGGLLISYANLDPGSPSLTPLAGRSLRVRLRPAPVANVWQAVSLADDGGWQPRGDTRLDGVVTEYQSETAFSVDGVPVDASKAQRIGGGLAQGARVRVEGVAQEGTVLATRVQVRAAEDVNQDGVELNGFIESLNTTTKTLVVRGVTVDYSASDIEFRDGTVADLVVGRAVQVKGLPTEGGGVRAVRIRVRL